MNFSASFRVALIASGVCPARTTSRFEMHSYRSAFRGDFSERPVLASAASTDFVTVRCAEAEAAEAQQRRSIAREQRSNSRHTVFQRQQAAPEPRFSVISSFWI